MLILRRKIDEIVYIYVPQPQGEPLRIEVMVTDVDRRNNQVALGFKAPKGILILRKGL